MRPEHKFLKMYENELGQTRTSWKVNNLNSRRHKSKRTRRVIIFPRFMRDSALFEMVGAPFNGKQTEMARTRSTWCLTWVMRFIASCIIKFDAPSRTITYSNFTPLPIVKALYKVSKNITPSKTSTPVHAIAATGSLSHYDHLVICNPVTYIDPYDKCDQSYHTE
jgi:hypothetical protein